MLTIALGPRDENEWRGENPAPKTFRGDQRPLLHQIRTMDATTPLIINANDTGTGKTKAALLRLKRRVAGKTRLDPTSDNVLFIAPTNELLRQHVQDIKDFCEENALPYRVVPITRLDRDSMMAMPGFSEIAMRKGAALHTILRNPRTVTHDADRQATIFVVNPDIFYFALTFQYGRHDRIPLFEAIFGQCAYIVIDEFHYYTSKQLACFLFFMLLSQQFGYFAEGRQICLLTATPDPRVMTFLERLAVPSTLIAPESLVSADEETQPVRALAPITIRVYSADELQGQGDDPSGLVTLVDRAHREIASRVAAREDGAIISGSLWSITQIHARLGGHLPRDAYGRITGPETREGRQAAARKPLILATPTVDIGYNFERGAKDRQNIDFLFCDARSGDELLQRLGRAGRVLGKPLKDIPSHVAMVVPQDCYDALRDYDGQTLERQQFRAIVIATMPPRNDLYTYIQTGAIAEMFLPLYRLSTLLPKNEEHQIITLFEHLRDLFGGSAKLTYQRLKGRCLAYLDRDACYSTWYDGARQPLEALSNATATTIIDWQKKLIDRMNKAAKEEQWTSRRRASVWIMADARAYFAERARFSFRDAFQPPQALIFDPDRLHTSTAVISEDVLRLTRFYTMRWYGSAHEWQAATGQPIPETADVVLWGRILALRPPQGQLQLGLCLDASDDLRADWEAEFAYQITAFYGVTIRALSGELDADVSHLLEDRFLPALVVREDTFSASALWSLRRRAQFVPYPLDVQFADGSATRYWAVLGTQALLIGAEIQPTLLRDSRSVHAEDNRPLIC